MSHWDFHTDLITQIVQRGNNPRADQLDEDSARGMAGLFNAAVPAADLKDADGQFRFVLEQAAVADGLAERGYPILRTKKDLAALRPEETGQVLHVEGCYFIQEQKHLDRLTELWARGFRSIGLLYDGDSPLGGGARGDHACGLSSLGRDAARQALGLGFILDAAHANDRTVRGLLRAARGVGGLRKKSPRLRLGLLSVR